MESLVLDGQSWNDLEDFYVALLSALCAPSWHGHSVNALIDSVIYGGINGVNPPYVIDILNLSPSLLRDEITEELRALVEAWPTLELSEGQSLRLSVPPSELI